MDLTTCAFSADKGAPELKTVWQDPDYDTEQSAFYYVRVLMNPTCRWSTYDAIRLGRAPDLRAADNKRAGMDKPDLGALAGATKLICRL